MKPVPFEDFTDLQYCGDCPYLKSEPSHEVYVDYPEDHIEGTYIKEQKNECLLKSLSSVDIWKGSPAEKVAEYFWFSLDNGENPKRHPGCLVLAKHIYEQIAEQQKWRDYVAMESESYDEGDS
jgi:hypothetical protein